MSWESFGKSVEKGPYRAGCAVMGVVLFFGVCLSVVGCVAGWFGEANQVARDEVGPKALLRKYETFKDMAASLDKKQADIKVYEARAKAIEDSYAGRPRSEWQRDDREAHRQAQAELAGLKASYNALAANYNAAMAKENWRFANAGDLPEGGKPLPREYRTYLEN